MLLVEFMHYNKQTSDPQDDGRYLSQNDTSVLKNRDLRKTRLTLKDINEIRKAAEANQKEQAEESILIRKMYAMPPPEAAPT